MKQVSKLRNYNILNFEYPYCRRAGEECCIIVGKSTPMTDFQYDTVVTYCAVRYLTHLFVHAIASNANSRRTARAYGRIARQWGSPQLHHLSLATGSLSNAAFLK